MIIVRTPYRISFFGGTTDYPQWYKEHGGIVISTTINKYSFLTIRKLPEIFDYKYRIRYYEKQETQTVDDIQIPVVREAIKYTGITTRLDITHHGDLPNRTGTGSSSSFTVSLLHGLNLLSNKQQTKRELALGAIHLEQNILKQNVGSQDQVAASFGGFNKIEFGGHQQFTCYPLLLKRNIHDELESWIQLFFTEDVRDSSDSAKKTIASLSNKKQELSNLVALTLEAESVLFSNNERSVKTFAKLLNEEWKIKKLIEPSITNNKIDAIYKQGISAGAVGGKLLGAGGGGFMLFLTPPYAQKKVADALKLKQVSINFEHLGSQMIYYDNQDL
jgi:D-glycero-alpha-D-manno-heptose-7-phosphate kinase